MEHIKIKSLYKLIDRKVHCLEKKEYILGWLCFMCEVSQNGEYDSKSEDFLKEFLFSELNINGSEYYVGLISKYLISVAKKLPENEEHYLESMRLHYA